MFVFLLIINFTYQVLCLRVLGPPNNFFCKFYTSPFAILPFAGIFKEVTAQSRERPLYL
jgi:hypothetical protein